MKGKKGATSISIFLLVLMALALTGAALYVFLTSDRLVLKISDVRFVEEVYTTEEKINFYLSQDKTLEEAVNLFKEVMVIGEWVEVDISSEGMSVAYRFKPKTKEK